MKRKFIFKANGDYLHDVDSDYVFGEKSKDVSGGRWAKVFDVTKANLALIRQRKMKIDSSGKLVVKPETEWPEALQAKAEQFGEDKEKMIEQVNKGNILINPDGSWNIPVALAMPKLVVK